MKARQFLIGLSLFSTRVLPTSEHVSSSSVIQPGVNDNPVIHLPPSTILSDQCLGDSANPECNPKKVSPTGLILDDIHLNLDEMVVTSKELSKSNPKLAKKFKELVKEVLIELLENQMVACKLKILEALPRSDLEKVFPSLTGNFAPFKLEFEPFKIELTSQENLSGNALALYMGPPHHKMLLSPQPFNKKDEKEYSKLKEEIKKSIIHEIQHGFMSIKLCARNSNSKEINKVSEYLELLNKQIFSNTETPAPYTTPEEKKQFASLMAKGDQRVKNLLTQLHDVENNKADPETKKRIIAFRNEVSNFVETILPLNHISCPLKKILTILKTYNEKIDTIYKAEQHLLEKDATYHEYLTSYPQLFKYLFPELLFWHKQHSLPEYKECVSPKTLGK